MTMKLASEIYEGLSDRFYHHSHERDEVESIIAAKLEPVRDALDLVSFDSEGDSIVMPLLAHADWIMSVEGHSQESLKRVSEWFVRLADRIALTESAISMLSNDEETKP